MTNFTFTDTIAGYVTDYDASTKKFGLRTSDGREFAITITDTTYAELLRNLGAAQVDCTAWLGQLLLPEQYLYAHGIFYTNKHLSFENAEFEAKHLVFVGRDNQDFPFENPDWWINQIRSLADFYLRAQFQDGEIDYRRYRSNLDLYGKQIDGNRQETDTISRLVYGFATAYLLTGEDRYLEAAEKGTTYLREHMRYQDCGDNVCYWYHGIDLSGSQEQKIFASEFNDDYYAIPAYEQIYALVGPTQTYRITGCPKILNDIEMTVNLFDRYFLDKSAAGGYFSHIDPVTLSPVSKMLGRNQGRKNWNSVGDHAPAYLINLWLATGEERYAQMLTSTANTIVGHFIDDDQSPFVQERFHGDWTHDTNWGWQKNRAVIGHNLKIAWNLIRINHLQPNPDYVQAAHRIAALMPTIGSDQQRGGWYDMLERLSSGKEAHHRFVWHDRKAWWQQEQAILAYLILAGSSKDSAYRKLAREAAAFYNAWFLDHEAGGVYFSVQANGLPYLLGNERRKGSHSMSGYHAFELTYLATIYTNLLLTQQPVTLYFKPKPDAFKDNLLRVQPDILPAGSVKIQDVQIDGQPHQDFDALALTVHLPTSRESLKVQVRLVPLQSNFDARLLWAEDKTAHIHLSGTLGLDALATFEAVLGQTTKQPLTHLVLMMHEVECVSNLILRLIILTQQKLGASVSITIVGAKKQILQSIENSEFHQRVRIIDTLETAIRI